MLLSSGIAQWKVGVLFSEKEMFFSSPQCPYWLYSPPSLLCVVKGVKYIMQLCLLRLRVVELWLHSPTHLSDGA
jgi:hypothetical protein